MRIGVIACDMLRKEFDLITRDDPDVVHLEYLDFALHGDPQILKSTIEEKVKELFCSKLKRQGSLSLLLMWAE